MHSTNLENRNHDFPDPRRDLFLIITIPASNEPEVLHTLRTLLDCRLPPCSVEVLVALNTSENANPGVIRANQKTERDLSTFSGIHSIDRFRFHCIHRTGIPEKLAGAGFARKIAMDHALFRFQRLHRPEGIILSLDADTLCEPNYLCEVYRHFQENRRSRGSSIYFEHPLEGNAFSSEVYQGITEYELHLRYFIQGLRHAGHPHAYHTLGSCFAVRAGAYESQGGMNKRKAGEDFYFLHKIIPLGNYHEINTTCLEPSPRPSLRVPFGTGRVTEQFNSGKISYLESYHPQVFEDLKCFLETIPCMFRTGRPALEKLFQYHPGSIRACPGKELFERIDEINRNTSGEAAFRKRFFRWFGIFRATKFINQAHRHFYRKQPVTRAVSDFLQRVDPAFDGEKDTKELLSYLRQVQRRGV